MTIVVQRAANAHNTKQVSEVENSFLASNITIIVGDTVTWTNNGMEDHTTTSDTGLWDSGRMVPGKSFSHTFKATGVFTYNCTFHKTMGMRGRVNVLALPPVIGSPLSVSGAAGLPFYYAIDASGSPTTFTADPLPPGLLLSGHEIVGTPAATGMYVVTLGASSASGADSKTLTIQIVAATPESDLDGDGFSDGLEILTNSAPDDPSSTPFGIPAGAVSQIAVKKLAIALNFSTSGRDRFTLRGTLNVAGQPALTGAQVAVDFGGIVKLFTLDSKGSFKSGNDSFKIVIKTANGAGQDASFNATLRKGDFAAILATIGLNGSADAKNSAKAISLTILFNGTHYQTTRIVSYTAKASKTGVAK